MHSFARAHAFALTSPHRFQRTLLRSTHDQMLSLRLPDDHCPPRISVRTARNNGGIVIFHVLFFQELPAHVVRRACYLMARCITDASGGILLVGTPQNGPHGNISTI